MDKVSLQNRRDFPLTTNSLAFMQAAYAAFEKLGWLGGEFYIVSGCVVTGSSVSDGYVYLNGQLMPFKGGTISNNVQIVEVTTSVNVDAGVRETTSYRAEFGVSTDPQKNVPWIIIQRLDNIKTLMEKIKAVEDLSEDNETDIAAIYEELDNKIGTDNVLTKTNTTSYTPSADYHPATKLSSESYTDEKIEENGKLVFAAKINIGGTDYIFRNEIGATIDHTVFNKSVCIKFTANNGFFDKNTIIPIATGNGTRAPIYNPYNTDQGVEIIFRDSSGNPQLNSFCIEIRNYE